MQEYRFGSSKPKLIPLPDWSEVGKNIVKPER